MNVIHIIVGLDVGGAELMLKRLIIDSQKNTTLRHSVVSLTKLGPIGADLVKLGVEVDALGMRSIIDAPMTVLTLSRIFRAKRPDIIQTWMYHADLLGGLAAKVAKIPNVIWGVRTTDVRAGGTRATTILMHVCARLSGWLPRVIVCAAQASRRVHVAHGYDDARMVVVPNGFDLGRLQATPEERSALRMQCGFGEGDLVVGILGRFDPAKDHHNFIRAAGILSKVHDHVRFLLVGRGLDTSNAELCRWIAETGCANRFVLLGQRSDVATCLSAMDVFCLSSRTEGFPNVVGEAMAMGLPAAVTDVGDAAFVVADTGVVVPKEDPAALADGLKRLIAMPAVARAGLGLRAKERIYAEFTIERTRERFESIYRSMATITKE